MSFHSTWRLHQSKLGFLAVFGLAICIQSVTGEDRFQFLRDPRASFNSWAGKRSSEEFSGSGTPTFGEIAQAIDDLKELIMLRKGGEFKEMVEDSDDTKTLSMPTQKRAAFNSWAGKRSFTGSPTNPDAVKRAPFNSWAGKRASFNSWAGKRGSSELFEDTEKVRFKRSSDESSSDQEGPRSRRSIGFSAWGGKRNGGNKRRILRQVPKGEKAEVNKLTRPVRSQGALFSAWGGR